MPQSSGALGCALAAIDGLAQQEFDLRVDAAQVIGGPALQILPQLGRQAQQEGLAVGGSHGYAYRVPVLMTGEASELPHSTTSRLLTMAALRSSSSLTVLLRSSSLQRHVHHADGVLHDDLAGGDDGLGLLPAQHDRARSRAHRPGGSGGPHRPGRRPWPVAAAARAPVPAATSSALPRRVGSLSWPWS